MKTFYTILLFFVLAPFYTHSQTVKGIPLSEINAEYIEIIGIEQPLSRKIKVELDYGQYHGHDLFSSKENLISDAQGNPYLFNSMIHALNFMSSYGYSFLQSYTTPLGDNQINIHFVLKKEKVLPNEDEKALKENEKDLSNIEKD